VTHRPESHIQADLLRYSRGDTRLFRNHVGQGWTGQLVRREGDLVVLANARPARFGLCEGSADLIGWHAGRFLAVEVKSRSGRASALQTNFIERVREAGGIAGICRSADDLEALLRGGLL